MLGNKGYKNDNERKRILTMLSNVDEQIKEVVDGSTSEYDRTLTK